MKLFNKINNETLKQAMLESNEERITLSFYQYHHIKDVEQFRNELFLKLDALHVFGRIYVASEGINGQISVPDSLFETFKSTLYSFPFLNGIRLNIAIDDDGKSFYKLKIKVKDKIVADGLNDNEFDVTKRGKHLKAHEFNQLVDRDGTVIVDMRNHYESEVGHFEHAICPDVETFRESLPIVEDMLADKKDHPIVMYCTGGIRCEKASAYFLHKGFKDVYMVDGGIIEYSRQCEKEGLPNKFIGKNFVFDERMGERISEDVIAKCHQCGKPCDHHVNCANDACHILFIQCEECAELFENTCSQKCKDYNALTEEQKASHKGIEFNGTRFGKGRYKAFKIEEGLKLT